MIAAIAAFFVFGTFGAWLLLVALCGLILWDIEKEELGLATFALIVTSVVLLWANDISLWSLITKNWFVTVGVIGGYFVAGTSWAIGKWYFYIRRYNHEYGDIKRDFLRRCERNDLSELHPEQSKVFRDEVVRKFNELSGKYSGKESFTFPLAAERKSAILGWMMYWPLSMTWTLINDPVKRAFIAIYRNISGGLDRMTKRLTGNISSEVDLTGKAQ